MAMEVSAMDMERGLLMLRPNLRLMPGLAMAAMAMEVSATDMERGLLMLRPSLRPTPGLDMVDSMATARGLLRLSPKPMPTSDMVDSMAMVLAWATAAMAMEVLATLMERGPLTPNL